MPTYTQYKDPTDTTAGPSPIIWADCPTLEMLHDPGVGYHFFDDFVMGGTDGTITTTIGRNGYYDWFGSAGATITYDGVAGGGIVLTEATDGESVSMQASPRAFNMTANGGKFWFEARIKVGDIVTLANSFFVGLSDGTLAAGVPLTTSGVLADMNCVGFVQPEADTTTFDCSYRADGVAIVEVNSAVGALVADTYVKLGMIFNPLDDNKLSFYINGAKQASTKTIPDNTGTDFPADVRMAPTIGHAVGAGAATDTLTMDWWRFAQLRT